MTFMSTWDITCCLGGDFNVVRFLYKRSTRGRTSSAMIEFSDFIDPCNLIDPPLEGTPYTRPSRKEVLVLFHIICLLLIGTIIFGRYIKLSFQRLLQITSYHFAILLRAAEVPSASYPFKFKNIWPKAEGFYNLVESLWGELNVFGSLSFILAKKPNSQP